MDQHRYSYALLSFSSVEESIGFTSQSHVESQRAVKITCQLNKNKSNRHMNNYDKEIHWLGVYIIALVAFL